MAAGIDDDVLVPNAHLHVSGMPPIPRSIADRTARYTGSSPVETVAWHPTRRAILVAARHDATMQPHLIERPLGPREPLCDGAADPVTQATFEPKRGDYLVVSRDTGGDEAAQLHRFDLADRRTTLLTDRSMKHGAAVWNHAGDAIVFESTALDRTQGGGREDVTVDLHVLDPLRPESLRRLATLPGGGWQSFRWTPDDRTLYALQTASVTDSTVWRIDVASGERTRVVTDDAVDDAARTVAHAELNLSRDGRLLVYASDAGGEFRRLTTLDLATGVRRVLTGDLAWDVVAIAMQGDARSDGSELVAAVVNRAGRHELHVFDVVSSEPVALPALPAASASGSVSRVRFARAGDVDEIAFTVNSARSPGDVWTMRLRSSAPDAVQRWTGTDEDADGLDTSGFREAEAFAWRSFDDRTIGGLISRPPARWTGRRPVLIHIHGGPESQAGIGFLGANNWFVDALGIAYIQPNVRGSTGYGRSFVSLDDGLRREDAVRDIGALLDWIASQPDLDAGRVLVAGRSYGGYMSLAVATTYAERIVASIAIVGISHFASFLERTESYRRDLRRIEYGDERDPAMRAFFDRISPLANADRIRKPLLVVAGRNDPRVPWQESEQIVAKVRGNGVPVWHLVADDEGHVFARKPNIEFVFQAQALFVQRYLLD